MIDLLPDEDQIGILDSIESFLSAELPISRFQLGQEGKGGQEANLWSAMAEMAWFSLGLPESVGGVGCSIVEEVMLLRAAGRHLVSPSLAATMLAAHMAARTREKELLASVMRGDTRVALAQPVRASIGAQVEGEFFLLDGDDAPLVLVWDEAGAALLDRAVFSGEKVRGIDESVSTMRVRIAAPARAYVPASKADYPLRAELYLAASLCGIAEAAQGIAAAYAGLRVQFGRPIGAFQAIKHMCADMAVRSESAACQAHFASLAFKREDVRFQVAAARLLSGDAARRNSSDCLQIHGGIGYTMESDPHRLLKRAQVLSRIGSTADEQCRNALRSAPI